MATAIVEDIVADLQDRRGLRSAWDGIDNEIQEEIMNAWTSLVLDHIAPNSTEPSPPPEDHYDDLNEETDHGYPE